MAAIAERRVIPSAESWTLPEQKPLIIRVARPWLQNPAGLFGLIVVVSFFVLGVIGPYVTPYEPRDLDVNAKYLSPSIEHPFGTNKLGQDMFSRILEGARLSFTFGAIVLVIGFFPGTALGILSGYAGRWVDYAIQRSGEAWTAFPQLPILLTVIAAVGPGLKAVVIVVAIGALFGGSRLMRAVALIEKHKDYVLAARSLGATEAHVLIRHVIPNIMPYILVGVSSVFAVAILAEAVLSYLGLGAEVGTPGWGIDLARGLDSGINYPHLVIYPGAVISIVILGFNLMGDTLRDILDPRLRGSQAAGRH
jgi:ABC-type dipeptide/oligopeptide/nickel transport system permease subunit